MSNYHTHTLFSRSLTTCGSVTPVISCPLPWFRTEAAPLLVPSLSKERCKLPLPRRAIMIMWKPCAPGAGTTTKTVTTTSSGAISHACIADPRKNDTVGAFDALRTSGGSRMLVAQYHVGSSLL